MKREYTVEDLKTIGETIEATGQWDCYTGEFSVNYSSILTKLIQEAGRWCEYYASDLFIDWESLRKKLKDSTYEGETLIFGFRQMGVDHAAYVISNMNSGCSSYYYRSIWRLDISVNNGFIHMELGKVSI